MKIVDEQETRIVMIQFAITKAINDAPIPGLTTAEICAALARCEDRFTKQLLATERQS